jgi:hypothetical protein
MGQVHRYRTDYLVSGMMAEFSGIITCKTQELQCAMTSTVEKILLLLYSKLNDYRPWYVVSAAIFGRRETAVILFCKDDKLGILAGRRNHFNEHMVRTQTTILDSNDFRH